MVTTVASFFFTLEDTFENVCKFLDNPNILVVTLEPIYVFTVLSSILFTTPKKGKTYAVQQGYSDDILRVRCKCYIKHTHEEHTITSIYNPYYTVSYQDIEDLIKGPEYLNYIKNSSKVLEKQK